MAERLYPGWGLAALRVVLGLVFFVHGWDGLFLEGGGTPFLGYLAALGSGGATLAWVVALLEFLGGLLLLVGWLTRWAAAVLFLETLVALFAVHAPNGFFVYTRSGAWGYEYRLVLLAGLACLALAGAGKLAVDDWLWLRRAR